MSGGLPRPEDASDADLRLAVSAAGPLAMYGGFLRAALAGIYAERQRVQEMLSRMRADAGSSSPLVASALYDYANLIEGQEHPA